jgi:hypothetical protein
MSRHSISALLVFLFIFLLTDIITAQTLDMQAIPANKVQIGLSYDKGFFGERYDFSTSSGIFSLSLNIPVSSKFNLIGSIPYINTSYKINNYFGPSLRNERGMGNIFIGLQSNKTPVNNKRSIVTFGVYLPTVWEDAGYLGSFANYYYSQQFSQDMVGVYFNYAYHKIIDEGFSWGLELGPNFYISTDRRYRRTSLTLHYGLGGGYGFNNISIRAELLGMALLTGSPNSFGDILAHLLDLGAQWNGAVVRPKLFYRIYLSDKFENFINGSLGAGVSVVLN